MIAVEAKDQELPELLSIQELYELLQSYCGRIVRAKTTLRKTSESYYTNATHIDQRFGKLQGVAFLNVIEDYDGSSADYINLILEGQGKMFLRLPTLSIEVLQEDTQSWNILYLGSQERKNR